MIGQEKLEKEFSEFTLQTLPKTVMLIGQEGCGKHLFVDNLAKRFDVKTEELDITSDIDERIADYQSGAVDTFYIIDLDRLDENKQNKILKFIEEPAKHVFIFVLASSDLIAIETIDNRCQKYEFEEYSVEDLKKITGTDYDDFIYRTCKTPGELKKVNPQNIKACRDLCNTFINKVDAAGYQNAMSIINKFNFKDQYDKIDPVLFINMLETMAVEEYKKTNSEQANVICRCLELQRMLGSITSAVLNKQWYLQMVISKLWEATR